MTAAALADAVDVDTTTVVRFAQRLGYPGFPDSSRTSRSQVKLELSQTYATPSEEEGVHSKVQMLVAKDQTNLEKALAHNTLETIENILDMLPRPRASWLPVSRTPNPSPSPLHICSAMPGSP